MKKDIYADLEARAPYRPVDDFYRGPSLLLTAKHVLKNIVWNRFMYCAVLLLGAVLTVVHFMNINPQQSIIAELVKSPLTDNSRIAIELFSELDQQCMSMGREHNEGDDTTCMGPPYLYVSYHGSNKPKSRNYMKKEHQICKFTRDGCGLGAVLLPSSDGFFLNASRGIYIHPTSKELYVAESYRKASRIRVYSDCNQALYGRREPLRDFTYGGAYDPALIHPYSVISNPRTEDVYISTQGTFNILRYTANGEEGLRSAYLNERLTQCNNDNTTDDMGCTRVNIPDLKLYTKLSGLEYNSKRITDLKNKELSYYNYPNSFAILPSEEGLVRGIAIDRYNYVYLGAQIGGLKRYDTNGKLLKTVTHLDDGSKISAVSVLYDESTHSIWTACTKNHLLLEFNPDDLMLKRKISFRHKIKHPTGLHIVDNEMFFISQNTNEILKFNLVKPVIDSMGRYETTIVLKNLIDYGEFITMSDC